MPQKFDSDGVTIAFLGEGDGFPTLLIHGFGSNYRVNWLSTSWVRDLVAAGRRVIALDNRGHGESDKPHDPAAYRVSMMAEDSRRLLDHLGVEKADVIGYSMGARIAASFALAHPARVRSAVFGGLGDTMVKRELFSPSAPLIAALRADSLDEISDPRAGTYRTFADQTGSDREALVACILGARDPLPPADARRIAVPVLVAVGSDDVGAGSAEGLAALIPGAEAFTIPGRDHMKAVGDKAHKAAVLAFLARQSCSGETRNSPRRKSPHGLREPVYSESERRLSHECKAFEPGDRHD
jgi:pimeloyl-ACP methyl ester carboxylesterase